MRRLPRRTIVAEDSALIARVGGASRARDRWRSLWSIPMYAVVPPY